MTCLSMGGMGTRMVVIVHMQAHARAHTSPTPDHSPVPPRASQSISFQWLGKREAEFSGSRNGRDGDG